MKLDVEHNSIRFGLEESDMLTLQKLGECRESITFPGSHRLEYVLSTCESTKFAASFAAGVLVLAIPTLELNAWHLSDQFSLSAEIPLRQGETLQVLIEKDFAHVD
jgi:hypothetical protein